MSTNGRSSDVAHRLSRGLGIPCVAIEGQEVVFGGRARSVLVVFVNGLGGAECLWVLEHALAVSIAGAFLHQHSEELHAARQEDRLPQHLEKALSEFFRTALPVSEEALRFEGIHTQIGSALRPDVEALLHDSPSTQPLQLTLQGYGSGRLTALGH